MNEVFIEAESFKKLGGWVIDQQSMEVIHSSYIMAHGMGVPVEDAYTNFVIQEGGSYSIWALTRDWTAVWNIKESAGRFKIAVDGVECPEVLGTNGTDWAWQRAARLELEKGVHEIRLCDMTGLNGRCDAIYITDSEKEPSNDMADIDAMRKRLNWKEVNDGGSYDLIVAGGGVAGTCTALSAMRLGLKVLLINDRGVLGGCNSSEVRVCMGGNFGNPPYEKLGNIVREIAPAAGSPEFFEKKYYEDDRKLLAFEAYNFKDYGEYSIRLNEAVTAAETAGGYIKSLITTNTVTGKKTRYNGQLFSDCTGDAVLSRLCGAEVMYGRESKEEFGESLAADSTQNMVMGHSVRWYSTEEEAESSFPNLDWKMPFNDDNCLDVKNGDWEQETGFCRNMVSEAEYIRDYGLRAIYSNWSYQKNHFANKAKYARSKLKWVSPLGGKRESYRVKGGYILTQNDIENKVYNEDATACITWSIDMHFPEPENMKDFGEPFRSFAYHRGIEKPYPIPYRCLYAKDIKNLFLGGRIVSASHVAFSALRVMRTLGQLGEVAAMAARICIDHNCDPADVYGIYLSELKTLMTNGIEVPQAFGCKCESEETYHFKDIGWLHLNPYSCDRADMIEKYKRGIEFLGLSHKYNLPDWLK